MNPSNSLNNYWDPLDPIIIHLDWDIWVLKKESNLTILKKGITKVRTPNPLVIIVERKDILLVYAGARM